jgi:hypothetical protein
MRNCDLRYCKTQLMDEAGKGEMMREDPNHGAYCRKKSSKTWQENEKGDVVTTPLERWWERERIRSDQQRVFMTGGLVWTS